MTPERWSRIEDLFLQAVDMDPAGRNAWLNEQCADDTWLRSEVDRLLQSDAGASAALGAAVGDWMEDLSAETAEPRIERIGPYEILSELGRGGMGVVYLARRNDDVFRKEVAIKVVKRGMDTDQILRHFSHERRILARLEHPSIARIIDGGSTEDRLPYLVMEYVEGLSLSEYCSRHRLPLHERLELFCKVCAAVEYAHRNLVVHRDLKPSNILVDSTGTPKLLDFGIAKLLAPDDGVAATITAEGSRALTPQYASPEQISGDPITPASDIYSLGTILYALLTGAQAHRITTHTPIGWMRAICENEVVLPSAAARNQPSPPVPPHELAGDLDNILLMALRKDREDRYGSVHLLAEDLRRFLADLPVLARPQTLRYRAVKFLRRNRMPVFAAAVAAASMIAGTAVSIHQAHRAERRYQEVRSLANTFLFDIHDQIEVLPGSTKVRELMVRTALQYLNNLAREASDDPSLQYELATAYQKIGDVQGYAVRPNLGQFADALKSHQTALEIAGKLAARGYEPRVQRLLAMAHHRVGYLSQGALSKDPNATPAHYRQSIELLDRLHRELPRDVDTMRLLVTVYGHQGDTEITRGNVTEAAADWDRALEVAREWSVADRSDAATLALGNAYRRVGRAWQLRGDLPKALDNARKAIELHDQLAAKQPNSTALQREVLNSYERLAFTYGDNEYASFNDLASAYDKNRKVVEIAKALFDADRNNKMAASDLAVALRSACMFVPESNAAVTIRVCQDAIDFAAIHGREILDVQPVAALRMAPALVKLGRRSEALKMTERAAEVLQTALAAVPLHVSFKLELLRIHNLTGELQLQTGDRAGALNHFHSSLTIAQELLPGRRGDAVLLRDFADCYRSLGRYYAGQDTAQARDWFQREFDTWNELSGSPAASAADRARRAEAGRSAARYQAPQ